jgi:hypothetical protein
MEEVIIHQDAKVKWEDEVELSIMLAKYQSFSKHSYTFLSIAKDYEWYNSSLQILIIILGLVTSFVSAISGINDQVRVYITSSFALLSSILAGVMRIKNYGEKFGTYNLAYKDYKDITTQLRTLLTTLKSEQTYEELNVLLTKKESQHEILIPRELLMNDNLEGDLFVENVKKKIKERQNEKAKAENATRLKVADMFIERKKVVFGYEIRTRLYEKYVVESLFKDNVEQSELKTYEDYVAWMRINHSDYYNDILNKFKEYQDTQISVYYLDNKIIEQNYDLEKIDQETKLTKILLPSDEKFEKILADKFKEYMNTILTKVYEKEDYGQHKFSYEQFFV